jgi:lipopolysaccharide export system protein LptA
MRSEQEPLGGLEIERDLGIARRVVIRRDNREARGEEARYVLAEETVVLTGQPVLIDQERGTVEGDKLIFHLSDGRIQVENTARERSVIIIRS